MSSSLVHENLIGILSESNNRITESTNTSQQQCLDTQSPNSSNITSSSSVRPTISLSSPTASIHSPTSIASKSSALAHRENRENQYDGNNSSTSLFVTRNCQLSRDKQHSPLQQQSRELQRNIVAMDHMQQHRFDVKQHQKSSPIRQHHRLLQLTFLLLVCVMFTAAEPIPSLNMLRRVVRTDDRMASSVPIAIAELMDNTDTNFDDDEILPRRVLRQVQSKQEEEESQQRQQQQQQVFPFGTSSDNNQRGENDLVAIDEVNNALRRLFPVVPERRLRSMNSDQHLLLHAARQTPTLLESVLDEPNFRLGEDDGDNKDHIRSSSLLLQPDTADRSDIQTDVNTRQQSDAELEERKRDINPEQLLREKEQRRAERQRKRENQQHQHEFLRIMFQKLRNAAIARTRQSNSVSGSNYRRLESVPEVEPVVVSKPHFQNRLSSSSSASSSASSTFDGPQRLPTVGTHHRKVQSSPTLTHNHRQSSFKQPTASHEQRIAPTPSTLGKRGPECMRRCILQGLLHPVQCHSLC